MRCPMPASPTHTSCWRTGITCLLLKLTQKPSLLPRRPCNLTLAEAYTSLAYASLLYDWDWRGSEEQFRHAIELDPNYATAHHFYSIYLMAAGRHAEAQAEIGRALELDPLSLIINSVASWIYYEARQYDKALQQSQRALDMDPTYTPALLDHGMVYLRTGEYRKAIAQFESARSMAGDDGVIMSYLAQARALAGDQSGARDILLRIKKSSARRALSTWDLALVYSALGEKDKAIDALERAAEEHVGWVIRLGVDPALDPLRNDPRFQSLLRRIRTSRAASGPIWRGPSATLANAFFFSCRSFDGGYA